VGTLFPIVECVSLARSPSHLPAESVGMRVVWADDLPWPWMLIAGETSTIDPGSSH